jgi:hypothetical protein
LTAVTDKVGVVSDVLAAAGEAALATVDDIPDRLADLASNARDRISGDTKSSSRPWLGIVVTAALLGMLSVWALRRRRSIQESDGQSLADRPITSNFADEGPISAAI